MNVISDRVLMQFTDIEGQCVSKLGFLAVDHRHKLGRTASR